jgi:hypothetical protein
LISHNKIVKNGQILLDHPGAAEKFLDDSYQHFEIAYPKFHKMDLLCKLGFLAVEILLRKTEHEKKYKETDTGLVLSNTHASLDVDLKYAKTIQAGASPALFVYTLPNIVIGEISIRHRFKGENAFFVFRHFDGNFIAEYVNELFDNNFINNCICGWVDVLKEDYQAFLFLVERDNPENAIPFTGENLNQMYNQDHG